MKTKSLFFLIAFLCISVSQVSAQEFDLSSFSDDIEELLHKLEIGDEELEKCYEIYKGLSKSLRDLNEEIFGMNIKEVEELILKKYASANKEFQEVLTEEQYGMGPGPYGVQDLNKDQSKMLIEALVGEKGLIATHGLVDEKGMIGKKGARGNISIVVGTCIK